MALVFFNTFMFLCVRLDAFYGMEISIETKLFSLVQFVLQVNIWVNLDSYIFCLRSKLVQISFCMTLS